MNHLKENERKFWEAYLATLPESDRPVNPKVSAAPAGNFEMTDELLALYLQGKKWAGSGIKEDYVSAGDPLPAVGDYWILLDGKGNPGCILKTERVEFHKFYEVPESIAIAEGEGDLSLEHWREGHARFFEPHLEKWGVKKLEDATVVTEFFQLVHRA